MSLYGLSDRTFKKFHGILRRHPVVEEVITYRSRALGTHREGSDIDLCMVGKSLTDEHRRHIWLDLDELNTPYLIDLSVYHFLQSESLLGHIARAGRTFYRKDVDEVTTAA